MSELEKELLHVADMELDTDDPMRALLFQAADALAAQAHDVAFQTARAIEAEKQATAHCERAEQNYVRFERAEATMQRVAREMSEAEASDWGHASAGMLREWARLLGGEE